MIPDTFDTRLSQRLRGVAITAVLVTCPAHSQEPDIFSADADNRSGLTFSPDGRRAYWTEWDGAWGSGADERRTIFVAHRRGRRWSDPEPVAFTGPYSDDDPFVSPDGRWLYFTSDRPPVLAGDATPSERNADIWRYRLDGSDTLERLDINSPAAEYSPVATRSGVLYFASARQGGPGRGDIYRAEPAGDGFRAPEALGPAVNSATGEWNLWISPDDSEMIFEASSRATNVSVSGDLYYSFKSAAGWTAAVPIAALNTAESDLMPRFDARGETLFYTTVPDGVHARIVTAAWEPIRETLRDDYAPTLMVANRSSHEVTFVDLGRATITDRIVTGKGPHLLSNVGAGRMAVTGYGEYPEPHAEPATSRPPFVESPNSRLTLIDTVRRSVLLDGTVEDCRKPHASWLIDGHAYVTCETEKEIAVVDLESGRTVDRLDTRQEGSHVLHFVPEARTLAVANTDSGSVTLIDIDSRVTEVVKTDGGSEGLTSVDGRLWVGNASAGSIAIVDPSGARVEHRIDDVCSFPIALDGSRGVHVWVACFGSGELVAIDRSTYAVRRRIDVGGRPLNLVLHPWRGLAYASLPRDNAVAEIDLASGEVVRRVDVGIEPDGLRWADVDR